MQGSSDQPITIEDSEDEDAAETVETSELCRVCGMGNAAMHYGTLACVGCKGFFRRALISADQLECVHDGTCTVTKENRVNCRACRFKKCLDAGMKPAAVRPSRELTSKSRKKNKTIETNVASDASTSSQNGAFEKPKSKNEWMKKLTVEMRTTLMNLLNIEAKIMKGDTTAEWSKIYPLKECDNLKELVSNPDKALKGKRTEMRYEPFRMARNNELYSIAYRRLIAAVDWVESLTSSMLECELTVDDKVSLVKNCYTSLMVFKIAMRTAVMTTDENVLCLCNFSYVPRNLANVFSDSYHLANGIVPRILDELVKPYRLYSLSEEELVCLSAMIVLNPLAKDLSATPFDAIIDLRNRITDTLFHVIKESRNPNKPAEYLGRLLLSLPTVTALANTMCENLQFAQTFSREIPLITDLFGCFPVEPFEDEMQATNVMDMSQLALEQRMTRDAQTQTEPRAVAYLRRKRRHDAVVEVEPPRQQFRLLQAPTNYYITEILDDLQNGYVEEETANRGRSSSASVIPDNQPSTNATYHVLQPPTTDSQLVPPVCQPQQLPIYRTHSFPCQQISTLTDHNTPFCNGCNNSQNSCIAPYSCAAPQFL